MKDWTDKRCYEHHPDDPPISWLLAGAVCALLLLMVV